MAARDKTPLSEFLRSGGLARGVLRLPDEAAAPVADDHGEGPQRRVASNAARVALAAARAFDQHCHEREDEGEPQPRRLTPADVLVVLDPRPGVLVVAAEIVPPTNAGGPASDGAVNGQPPAQQLIPSPSLLIPVLGGLLYSIFSQGPPPDDILKLIAAKISSDPVSSAPQVDKSSDNGDDGESLLFQQLFQKSRITEISLFTRLADSDLYPTTVCRLLSDMIDSDTTETPFASIQEVLQDLEGMVARPHLFLHNTPAPQGEQERPKFGRAGGGRREEVARLMDVAARLGDCSSPEVDLLAGVETVFIPGRAGSGKSHLAQVVGDALQGQGWLVARAKFERGKAHSSQGLVSAMFDGLVAHVVALKKAGRPEDVAYCHRVSRSMRGGIGRAGLAGLVGFLPSLPLLFPGLERGAEMDMVSGQLIYPLSKILEAFDRCIMICCDDLQWADSTSLSFLSDLLMCIGGIKLAKRRCLFLGLFRREEIDDYHPLSIQRSYLQMSSLITTTEIQLSSVSKDDVVEMLMATLRLPRRIVYPLADLVFKKTSGHAIYVVELLNSLLNESLVAWSPRRGCYAWDLDRIGFIETHANVAELIAANLTSLSPRSMSVLRILSCFGIQTDMSLLQVLSKFQEEMTSLDEFVERGILDTAGPIVLFTHDFILQAVYEGMSEKSRRSLHLELGEYLGANTSELSSMEPLTKSVTAHQKPFFAGSQLTSSLVTLACDQIDNVKVDFIEDLHQQVKYAQWNLIAAQKVGHESNFCAALYYIDKGISFLGKERWQVDLWLCASLHEGAVMAAFALGEIEKIVQYSNEFIAHVPFEETLGVQLIALKSLVLLNKLDEVIMRVFGILAQKRIIMPSSPTEEVVMNAMANVDEIASQFSIHEITNQCEKFTDETVHGIIKICKNFFDFFFYAGSYYFPLLLLETVKYSLQNGVCHESASVFAVYGGFKIIYQHDFVSGKKWSDVSRAIIKNYQTGENAKISHSYVGHRALATLYNLVDIWFLPLREIASKLLCVSDEAMKLGIADDAIYLLAEVWSMRLYCGEKLSMISQSALHRLQLIVKKYSQNLARWVVCDCILLMELTGKDEDYFSVFDDSIQNLDDIQSEVPLLSYRIQFCKMMCSFWKGDYVSAEEQAHTSLGTYFKLDPKTYIYHTFFSGLISFQLYRTLGGDERLKNGKEMLDQMKAWADAVPLENKRLLLEAEYAALTNEESNDAEQLYKSSIKAARDHLNIHELALAYELLGSYHAKRSQEDSNCCFEKAFVYYTQWGAIKVAQRVSEQHDLNTAFVDDYLLQVQDAKHARQEH